MFQEYFNSLQKDFLADAESSEHSFRTYFQNLLHRFEETNIKRKLNIKHEPTAQQDNSRPDFKVTTSEQLTIGLIETKKIGENLAKTLNSKQLEKYRLLSDNLILTDYLQFYLIKNGEIVFDSWVFRDYELKNKKHKVPETRIIEMTKLLTLFFESEPEAIYKTKDLALRLAEKAKFLKEYSLAELETENNEDNLLFGLYEVFKHTLLPQLDIKYFADIYAQTVTYGLFLSALNCDDPNKELNKNTAYTLLPNTFPLIKELFHSIDNFPSEIVWAIDEIISILKVTDFTAIKKEFAEYRNAEKGFSDPFIFFYEDFLKHYDKSQRELRGVYYTPEPVVSFVVRSIEIILKEFFGINDGFVNKNVTALDFATGTGTFFLYLLKQALEQAGKIGDKVTVNKILNEQILNNFYGFELLVAPYVIAHLKISEFLKEQGFTIEKGKRLNIFLTNTLNNDEPESFPIMPSLSKEGREANKIKNKDILIITGNPPYSGHSANVNDWIQDKMKIYYEVDGKPLGERNPKWLQDDYVKFLRFAQWKIDSVERGVVGVITNHGFLDNPTFRGMRKALMRSFDEIYIIDLHGNAKKKEKCPDGSKDENVFDIQQGVAITLFVKRHSKESICQVHHFELFGLRQNKYDLLWQMDILNIKWNKANPNTPHYLFKPRNESFLKNYDEFISLKEIFNLNGVGITTAHDEFVIDFDKEILLKRFREFQKSLRNEEQLHQYFKVKKKKGWSILRGYDEIKDEYNLNKYLKKINYRPFDDRWIFYQNRLVWRTVKNLMTNMKDENIALMTNKREELDLPWSHSLVTQYLSEHGSMSSKTTNYHFPLYIISEEETFLGVKESALGYNTEKILIEGEQKTENFIEEFRNFIDNKYKDYNSPEQILGYIYAILHSPTYREKYIEFLKIDFPRIPFTDDENMFRQLSEIGWELIQHHLLKINYKDNISRFEGGDNCKVEKVSYDKGKVWINNDRYFDNVPQAIWEFYIGGYQVLDKWLKERKKHEITLSTEDFRHFIKVVNVIDYTIKTMEKIDELTGEWV